jgi:hypothetical protein
VHLKDENKYCYFQRLALSDNYFNKELPIKILSNDFGPRERFLKEMREYGFDVRTHNTNRTILEGNFRICYPFTLPVDLNKFKLWTDRLMQKKNDFDIDVLLKS